jgi:hypothetical protein
MPNLRIVSDNAADRGTTTVSSSVGAFGPGNLKNDLKSLVWRSSGSGANLITKPNSFEDALWLKNGVIAVTANAAVAPDGTKSAEMLTRNSTATPAYADLMYSLAVAPGYMESSRHSFSIWLWTLSGTSSVTLTISDGVSGLSSDTLAVTTTPTKFTFDCPEYSWAPTGTSLEVGLRMPVNSSLYAWGAFLIKSPQQSISTTWNTPEKVSGVALPFTNLTSTASMRVRLSDEVAKTNLLTTNSEVIGAGANMTVTQGIMSAPDNKRSAGRHIPSASAVAHEITIGVADYIAGQSYTVSFYSKLHIGSPFYGWNFQASADIGGGGAGSVRLNTLAVTGAGGIIATNLQGWYRVTMSFTATATARSSVLIRPIDAAGSYVSAGDGIKGIYLWGVQVELGTLSSYYPTVAAPATRPTGYIDIWQSYSYDNTVLACPATPIIPNGFTALQAQSAYAYGGGAYAKAWFTPAMCTGCRVDIIDIGNQSGYIEASRLIIGNYWSPVKNVSYGMSNSIQDLSKNTRTQSGDLISDSSPTNRKIAFNIEELDATDRKTLYSILRRSGMRSSMFISLTPENVDIELERDNMIYGKLSAVSAMSIPFFGAYSFPIEMEEI